MMNTTDNQQEELASADDVAEPPSGAVRRSPGNMLKAQRETLELTLQQVSEQLNLTMHYLRSLESDSYDKLPGDVFVRGYIRTYSRLLKLDPDQVLMIYDEYNSNKIARKEEAIKRHKRRRQDRNRPWIIVSGIAFVAVAVALWYLSPAENEQTIVGSGEADVVLEAAASVLAASANRAAPSAGASAIEVVEGAIRDTGVPAPASAATDVLPAEQSLPVLPGVVLDDVALAELSPEAMQIAASEDAVAQHVASDLTENHVDHQVADTGVSIVQRWTGTDELKLHFTNESWVEVEHKGDAEEHADTRRAGETLTIYGTAPFAVLLGDARAVELTLNGRTIDISSNIRADNTARLSIGM